MGPRRPDGDGRGFAIVPKGRDSGSGTGIQEPADVSIMRRLQRWYERAVIADAPGLGPSLVRALFRLVSFGFAAVVWIRRRLYAGGWIVPFRASVPVICVGNITTGGAGKTPAAFWLCRLLARRGLRVALLSRGYGRTAAGGDDEAPPRGLLPEGVIRLTGRRRDRLAAEAVSRHGAQVVVLDDGFQHWRLARDLDLVCIDALDPFGNERLLPAGPLREPVSALGRAAAFLITRTDLAEDEVLGTLRARLRALAEGRPVAESIHRPSALFRLDDGSREVPLEWLRGRAVHAFCGIGNPRGFEKTLEALGASVVACRRFPDHHVYTEEDLRRVLAQAQEFMAEAIVTTEKDAARLAGAGFPFPFYALRIELEVVRGADALETAVAGIVAKASTPAAETVPD
jgi:tetraacyldisaccharide 4'-kinase